MNDYRITYTSETGEESNAYVTERTETAARKAFSTAHKGMGLTIQNVELHRENACATKQQERETLEAIKKMVEELGICIDTLRNWLKASGIQMGQASRLNREQQRIRELEAEVRSLRKHLGEKEEVIEILKKSVGILSKP